MPSPGSDGKTRRWRVTTEPYPSRRAPAPAHNNKGLALMQSGRVEEGGRLIEMAIALDEKSGLAFYNLSLSKKFEAGDDIISVMEGFAREAPLADAAGRIYVHFALGKAYADIGRFDASFEHFSFA